MAESIGIHVAEYLSYQNFDAGPRTSSDNPYIAIVFPELVLADYIDHPDIITHDLLRGIDTTNTSTNQIAVQVLTKIQTAIRNGNISFFAVERDPRLRQMKLEEFRDYNTQVFNLFMRGVTLHHDPITVDAMQRSYLKARQLFSDLTAMEPGQVEMWNDHLQRFLSALRVYGILVHFPPIDIPDAVIDALTEQIEELQIDVSKLRSDVRSFEIGSRNFDYVNDFLALPANSRCLQEWNKYLRDLSSRRVTGGIRFPVFKVFQNRLPKSSLGV